MKINCKICSNKVTKAFSKKVLWKYEADYLHCQNCGFIQIDEPHWLDEAYSEAITSLDVGLVKRAIEFGEYVPSLLEKYFDPDEKFLDYAGGFGLFVRLMRDKGYDFFRQDKYCENIFAKYFDIEDLRETEHKFELATAFEVFEHFVEPLKEIQKILDLSDNLLFSTALVPSVNQVDIKDWWYIVPETGQHICFFTIKSLEIVAQKMKRNLYSNGQFLHLLTKKTFRENPLNQKEKLLSRFVQNVVNRMFPRSPQKSFTEKDFEHVKKFSMSRKFKREN